MVATKTITGASKMALHKANGIELEVETHGAPGDPAIILVRGLGSQLIHWPPALIDGFLREGYFVVTFDNRDTGLSTKFADWGVPDIAALRTKALSGAPIDVPYTMRDMADDVVAVLDSLGIGQAHVMGISLGGMITQFLALHHAERFLSATIVMSSSGDPGLPPAAPHVWELLLAEPASHDRETVISHTLQCDYAWYSPAFPFDEAERRALIGRAYDRCYSPDGVTRQYAAKLSGQDRAETLCSITLPVLVIHGTHDTLVPVEHGRDLAARIPGATLVEIEGMGHDLEGAVPAMIVDHVTRLARSVAA